MGKIVLFGIPKKSAVAIGINDYPLRDCITISPTEIGPVCIDHDFKIGESLQMIVRHKLFWPAYVIFTHHNDILVISYEPALDSFGTKNANTRKNVNTIAEHVFGKKSLDNVEKEMALKYNMNTRPIFKFWD